MTAPSFPDLPKGRLARVGVLAAFWGVFTVLIVGHAYLTLRIIGVEYKAAYAVSGILQGLIWIPLTPLIARLVRRFPLAGSRWLPHIGVHFVLALAMAFVTSVLIVVFAYPFDVEPEPFAQSMPGTFMRTILLFELVYFGIAGAATAAAASREAIAQRDRATAQEAELREREVRAARLRERTAQLEGQLAAAQLEALRMQLNPHFLFNTLHAVSTLMTRDVDAARTMISDLSGLLRLSLDRVGESECPLDDELEFLGHYLDIERTRFADRLAVDIDVEAGARAALVPTLVLQPLVENAVKHGIAPRGEGGHVGVAAHRANGSLLLRVTDDGPGLPPGGPPRDGVGLANTRDRLAKLYGPDATLDLKNRPEGGLVAEVRLPFHTA